MKPATALPAQKKTRANDISDSQLRGLFGYNLKRSFSALQVDLLRVLDRFDLRMVPFSTLVMIVENPGLRQSQLADALAIERPNLVVVLDTLERRELITRDRVPTDRRAYALRATLAGHQLCEKAYRAVQAHEARYLNRLSTAEREALSSALNKIRTTFEEAGE